MAGIVDQHFDVMELSWQSLLHASHRCTVGDIEYQRIKSFAQLGNQLLQCADLQALKHGISQLYTLTTRTSHWFIENGFKEAPDFNLPAAKRERYNPERGSKILTRSI